MPTQLTPDDPSAIAGYPLLQRLGEGGMGRVYLSRTPGGRPIAIKVVRPELASDAEFRRRFQQEVRAAERVQGPYTVPVIDADTDGPQPWFATAYVPGPSLHEAVATHGPLPVWAAVRAVAGIAEALQAIHGAGVVHRDLKPSNVLLSQDGPKVIDFGIARAADATSLTRSGVTAGTPAFMAPEQAMGETVTPAVDVFALGQVAVFATCGRPPFGEGSSPAVVYRIVHEEPDLSKVPEPLRELTSRCLAKDPAARPSPAEVVELCRPLLGNVPPPEGNWLPTAMVTEIDHRAATVTSLTTVRPASASAPPPPAPPYGAPGAPAPPSGGYPPVAPEPPKRRGRTVLTAALGVLVALAVVGIGLNMLSGDSDSSDQGQGGETTAGQEGPDASEPSGGTDDEDTGPGEEAEEAEEEPPADPEPLVFEGISVPDRHVIRLYDDPPKPEHTRLGVTYEGDFGFSNDLINGLLMGTHQKDNTMVLLEAGETGSLETCRSVTRYTYSIPASSAPPGAEICVTTEGGDIGLVTVRDYSPSGSPSVYVTVDLTVWRGGAQPG
ncbi:serine/threonine-protein kinase [Streptomyces ginkgonis]|uniref:serine/threonine-protein kinase n=1 Tax=Streptomyces ginkgonis TaxID=1812259 RepID=UPI002176D9F6|nr:serine/threonine-protein kinase [Streptomyces ginkgonis]